MLSKIKQKVPIQTFIVSININIFAYYLIAWSIVPMSAMIVKAHLNGISRLHFSLNGVSINSHRCSLQRALRCLERHHKCQNEIFNRHIAFTEEHVPKLEYWLLDLQGKLPTTDDVRNGGRSLYSKKTAAKKKLKKLKKLKKKDLSESDEIIKAAAQKYCLLVNAWPGSLNLVGVKKHTLYFDTVKEHYATQQHMKMERTETVYLALKNHPKRWWWSAV